MRIRSMLCAAALAAFAAAPTAAQAAENCYHATGCYGAIALGTWVDAGTMYAKSAVVENFPKQERANDAAVQACNDGGRNCKVIEQFSNGACGFIALSRGSKVLKVGVGSTSQEAAAKCENGGFACGTPKGGCTKKPGGTVTLLQ